MAAPPAQNGRRVALVAGNNAYPKRPLVNPVNDARDFAAALKSDLGFETEVVVDTSLREMDAAIRRFTTKLRPGDTGLFYFSGHGVSVGGQNYLLPVSFNAESEAEVPYEAFPANRLRDMMASRGVRTSIIILDACRNNPYRTWRDGSSGLTSMTGAGAFVAFAADEGRTADDNPRERNGLFTKHMLQAIREPGLKIGDVFDKVRERVHAESGGRQIPFTYSGILGGFYFRPAAPAPPPVAPVKLDPDQELYAVAKEMKDPALLERAAERISNPALAEALRARANALRKAPAGQDDRAIPKLIQMSAKQNHITDDEEWYSKNILRLPVVWRRPNVLSRAAPPDPPAPVARKTADGRLLNSLIETPTSWIGLYNKVGSENFEGEVFLVYPKSGGAPFRPDLQPHFDAILRVWTDSFRIAPEPYWAWDDGGVLYVSIGHPTYARSSSGQNAYLLAFEMTTGKLMWKSAPLVSNAGNFILHGGAIISGYGFTAEPDFLYTIDKRTGKTLSRIPLATGPEAIIQKEDRLFVRTYDTDYVFRIAK